ncbi:MAG: hypothetical protein GX173_11160 [Ruminococcaceae bacterium]|nr:hypothetical protein [Oscillospiraceae bacterium]
MIVRDMTTSPVEEERVIIDKQTAQSTYQTGYSTVTVKAFSTPGNPMPMFFAELSNTK